jgi:hypothetical protein
MLEAKDAPASFHPLLHSEVRKRTIHAPILAHPLLPITPAAATSSPQMPLFLLMCEEQPRRTLRECVKRHPRVFPCKCQEGHARRVLREAEERVRLF